jgi:hypothetical protein
MPNVLDNQSYPDNFQIITVLLNHNLESAGFVIPIMYVESRGTGSGIVIDSIAIGINVVEGAAETVEVVHATTVEATSGLTSIQTATTSVNATGTTLPTINTSNNFVPAGSWVLAKFNAAQGTSHGAITIRFRNRLA